MEQKKNTEKKKLFSENFNILKNEMGTTADEIRTKLKNLENVRTDPLPGTDGYDAYHEIKVLTMKQKLLNIFQEKLQEIEKNLPRYKEKTLYIVEPEEFTSLQKRFTEHFKTK
jgi:hypothetical protein